MKDQPTVTDLLATMTPQELAELVVQQSRRLDELAHAEEYSGWTNYPTWAIALWMDNEQSTYRAWRHIAQGILDEAGNKRTATYQLSKQLKDEYEEAQDGLLDDVWEDLMGWVLEKVNWYEIAENLLEDLTPTNNDDDEDEEDDEEADDEPTDAV